LATARGFASLTTGRKETDSASLPLERPATAQGFRRIAGSAPELRPRWLPGSAEREEQWCVEPVPALGGLTPQEAAADPTRREQVIRLIDSFDRRTAKNKDALPGFRPARLRELLGL
jgi:hypothetical protein